MRGGLGRLRPTRVLDQRRGNEVRTFTYVSSTYQVASALVDGDPSYAYYSGRTERTDARERAAGPLLREEHHPDGPLLRQRRPLRDRVPLQRGPPRHHVKPRDNRVDFTRNGAGFVTERRQKTTDTDNTSSSDIVESWGYTNNFVTSYTDPLGNVTTYTRRGGERDRDRLPRREPARDPERT